MKMYIRSKCKQMLVEAKNLYIESEYLNYYAIVNDGYIIGNKYSKERAIEILDEIQDGLSGRVQISNLKPKEKVSDLFPIMIYVMPEN